MNRISKNRGTAIALAAILCLGLASCRVTPYLYYPNNVNMPLMGNKGELNLTGYIEEDNAYGFNGAYALDTDIFVFAGGNFLKGTAATPYQNYKYTLLDAGVGYYKHLGKHGRFELSGGIGYGTSNAQVINKPTIFDNPAYDSIENLHINAHLASGIVQADIGITSENVDLAFGIRIRDLEPTGIYTATYTDTANRFLSQRIMSLNGNALMLEPAIMLSAGIKYVKVNLQIGASMQLAGLKVPDYYEPLFFPIEITAGLTVNLFRNY